MGFTDWIRQQVGLPSVQTTTKDHIQQKCQNLSKLEWLPPELILCCTDFLNITDKISLSLCSHHLRNVTGKPTVPTGNKAASVSLLTRLSIDLPDMFCCHTCAALHRIDAIHHPAGNRRRYSKCPDIGTELCSAKPSLRQPFFVVHQVYSWYSLRHSHLVAAMKNYRTGHKGFLPDSLAYTEIVNLEQTPNVTTLLSVQARVCDSGQRLIMQVQQWVLAPLVDKHTVPEELYYVLQTVDICKHEPVVGYSDDSAQSIVLALRGNPEETSTVIHCCQRCGIEFKWRIVEVPRTGYAVVVTKWLDFGACIEFDDPKWRRITSADDQRITLPLIQCEGELHSLFQAGSGSEDGDPTDQNKELLTEGNYQKVLWTWDECLYQGYGKCGTKSKP
ncbi:hypothetical protein BDV18DRAFT_160641 [Aspergillus unguis]